MAHTTIYFLTEAFDYDDADSRVSAFLDCEHFFDYFNILPDESGPLELKREVITAYAEKWNWQALAESHLKQAEDCKAQGYMSGYGYQLRKVGELYEQLLGEDTAVFNIERNDYTIPNENRDWWVIAVDFHV